MDRRSVRWLSAGMLVVAGTVSGAACGGLTADGVDMPEPPSCAMQIGVESPFEAPQLVVATSSISKTAVLGFEFRQWTVEHNGESVEAFPRDSDSTAVEFNANDTGIYRMTLTGAVGGLQCASATVDVNATTPLAPVADYLLHVITERSVSARSYTVSHGADFSLGQEIPAATREVTGTVQTELGAPVEALLRIWPMGSPEYAFEVRTNANGIYEIGLGDDDYQVLVVPLGSDDPTALLSFPPGGVQDLVLPAPFAISGSVSDAGGNPIAGARVSLVVDSAPTRPATSNGSGNFTLLARSGNTVVVNVAGPGLGTPRLLGELPGGIALGDTLNFRFSGLSTALVPGQVDEEGEPLANAQTTWYSGTFNGAGTVAVNGGGNTLLDGVVHASIAANGSGALPAVSLPEATYQVVVEGASQPSLASVNLGLAPTVIDTPTPTSVEFTLDGPPELSGAEVRVTPLGELALLNNATQWSVADSQGRVMASLGGGISYQLVVEADPAAVYPRTTAEVTAAGPGVLTVPRAARVEGRVRLPEGVRHAHVSLTCSSCPESSGPVAEGRTAADGSFALAVPLNGD